MADDPVRRPAHYVAGRSIEPVDVIEDWDLDWHRGNALKYLARAGRKGDFIEDLEKCKWFVERAIAHARRGAK
jgi:hypothetical protein